MNSNQLWKVRSTYEGRSSAFDLQWATPVAEGEQPNWQPPTDSAHQMRLLTKALREKLLAKADLGLPATTSSNADVAGVQDAVLKASLAMDMPSQEGGVAKYFFLWVIDGHTIGASIIADKNCPHVIAVYHREEGLVPVEAERQATALGVGLAILCENERYYKSLAAEMAKPGWETSMARQMWLCQG